MCQHRDESRVNGNTPDGCGGLARAHQKHAVRVPFRALHVADPVQPKAAAEVQPSRAPSTAETATFHFGFHALRAVVLEGNPWFVARDIYMVLFGRTTGLNAYINVATDERMVITKVSVSDTLRSLFEGGQYRLALLSESGFNKLVMRSDKPEARKFQDWVTREVLPSIRKTGTYTMPGMERVEAEAKGKPFPLNSIEGGAYPQIFCGSAADATECVLLTHHHWDFSMVTRGILPGQTKVTPRSATVRSALWATSSLAASLP